MIETIKENKGKAAGFAALIPLLYTLADCYTTAQRNKSAIHANKELSEGNVPQWIYQSDRREMTSNIMALRVEIERLKVQPLGPTNR